MQSGERAEIVRGEIAVLKERGTHLRELPSVRLGAVAILGVQWNPVWLVLPVGRRRAFGFALVESRHQGRFDPRESGVQALLRVHAANFGFHLRRLAKRAEELV